MKQPRPNQVPQRLPGPARLLPLLAAWCALQALQPARAQVQASESGTNVAQAGVPPAAPSDTAIGQPGSAAADASAAAARRGAAATARSMAEPQVAPQPPPPPPRAAAPAPRPPVPPAPPPAPVAGLPPGSPPLVITGGTWSDDPRQRMVIVNNTVFREGTVVADGVQLEQIRPFSVVLTVKGQRVTVRY